MSLQQILPLLRNTITACCIIIGATSCGGGGGGGGGGGSSPTTSSSSSSSWISSITTDQADIYRTSEYSAQYGLESIKSAQAYALLSENSKIVAGSGVVVGVVDTGAQTTHAEISANLSATGNYDYYGSDSDVSDGNGHGTHVSSIIAGVKDGSGMHGVAYDAEIMMGKVFSDAGTGATDVTVAQAVEALSENGVGVINLSLGGSSGSTTLLNSMIYAASKDVVIVASTGNSSGSNPLYPARYASDASVQGYEIAVAASNSGITDLASFSNKCGDAMEYCLVAPGTDIYAAIPVGSVIQSDADYGCDSSGYCALDGTSMAAPHVSGAAAVIRGAWPHLSAPEVVQILLSTATDMGTSGVDSTYGHGMLNLYAAVQAQGQDTLGYGTSVISYAGYSVSGSSFSTDAIFGDAVSLNVAPQLQNAVFFDDYGRDYKANLDSKISNKNSVTVPSLDSFAFNNYSTRNLPISFGKNLSSKFNFQFRSYNNAPDITSVNATRNRFGLKFLTIDKSQEDKFISNSGGFSFVQDLSKNLKAGFAMNSNELVNVRQEKMNNFGFISVNNFAANPYQSFVSGSLMAAGMQRNYNQLFVAQKFFDEKFMLSFSEQMSYETPSIVSQIGNRQNQTSDIHLAFLPNNESNFSVSVGNLNEFNNNFLNSKAIGAFETAGDAKTSYFKISATKKLAKYLYLISSFSEGTTKATGNDLGIFRDYSDIRSRSSAIGLVRESIFGGKLGMIYSEPLRVYSGSANINIPIARDINGNITRYSANDSLVPQGKERDLEFFYSRNLFENSSLKFNFIIQKERGNVKGVANNYLGFANYVMGF